MSLNHDGMEPCPFCGEKNNLWNYISSSAALIQCSTCKVKLPNSEVRTIYLKGEASIPEVLRPFATWNDLIVYLDGVPTGGYWVPPTDSFRELGHLARWNTRTGEENHENNPV